MANGDHIDHIIRRGYVLTTDATDTVLTSIDLTDYLATECMIYISGWAMGFRDSLTDSYIERVFCIGAIDEGAVSIASSGGQVSLGSGGSGTNTYDVELAESSNVIQLGVKGDAGENVYWHGRLELDITEAIITEDGGGPS